MSHAEKCPICGGSGEKPRKEQCMDDCYRQKPPCHGCGGNGWVTVDDKNDPVYFITPTTVVPL